MRLFFDVTRGSAVMSLRELRGRLDAAGVVHDGLHGRAELLALARHTLGHGCFCGDDAFYPATFNYTTPHIKNPP